MKQKEEIINSWVKMVLNSSYGFQPVPIIRIEYDGNKVLQITEEGKKNLIVIQEALNNIL